MSLFLLELTPSSIGGFGDSGTSKINDTVSNNLRHHSVIDRLETAIQS